MSKKLLLADDSVTVQRVVELTFADEGIEVVSVPDGNQAVERIEREKPDIVLADVSMPGRDGYQVAEYVKNASHLSHIPVVLMTGAFEQLDDERARDVKCDAALAKPFEPQRVINLVNQLLRGEGGPGLAPVAPAAEPLEPATSTGLTPAQSLDDYLERLDDALTAATGPISVRSAVDRMPEPVAGPAFEPPPAAQSGAVPASDAVTPVDSARERATPEASPPSPDAPSLADAFSALLAAELGEAPLPDTWSSQGRGPGRAKGGAASSAAAPVITDAFVEEVSKRVLDRLTDNLVREVVERRVLEIAERLVLEEIERIKANAM